jgi:hypothetical protein
LMFIYLPYLFNVSLLICVINFQSSHYSTLISCSYLAMAFYVAINFKRLYMPGQTILLKIRVLNFVVLALYTLF